MACSNRNYYYSSCTLCFLYVFNIRVFGSMILPSLVSSYAAKRASICRLLSVAAVMLLRRLAIKAVVRRSPFVLPPVWTLMWMAPARRAPLTQLFCSPSYFWTKGPFFGGKPPIWIIVLMPKCHCIWYGLLKIWTLKNKYQVLMRQTIFYKFPICFCTFTRYESSNLHCKMCNTFAIFFGYPHLKLDLCDTYWH